MIFSRISVVFPNFSPQKWRFMQEKTQGVVLRTLKYNDNSLIVDIYTATRGTVSFMVKLPKSRKATLKGVFFRPLSILEIDFDYRQKSALQRIRDVRFKYVYQTLPYDPRKSSMALFLAEFLCRVLKHEEGSDTLFPISSILCNGWMPVGRGSQTSIWFSHTADAVSWFLSQRGGVAQGGLFRHGGGLFCVLFPVSPCIFGTARGGSHPPLHADEL